jgi:pimeloyl-ACP methyl ester carboxylesterase
LPSPIVLGTLQSGSGRPLLLVHGFPFDAEQWSEQMAPLAARRRVVAVDLRGRGRSTHAPDVDWTLDTHADDLARTLDELGVGPADVVGLSMGGYVAFAFLLRHPDKVASLTLIDSKSGGDTPEAKHGRDENARIVREHGTKALVPLLVPKLVAPTSPAWVGQKLSVMIERTPPSTCIRDLMAMRDRPDSDPAAVRVPALVLHGALDALMPVAAARTMAAAIPGARFVEIPGSGHIACLENADAVNQALSSFLAQLDRGA